MVIKCSGGWGWESVREVEGSRTDENKERKRSRKNKSKSRPVTVRIEGEAVIRI